MRECFKTAVLFHILVVKFLMHFVVNGSQIIFHNFYSLPFLLLLLHPFTLFVTHE